MRIRADLVTTVASGDLDATAAAVSAHAGQEKPYAEFGVDTPRPVSVPVELDVVGRLRSAGSERVVTLSQAESVYGLLRERILRCELMPGQRLTERLLVENTGFGKTPVREALARLSRDGLVETQPRSGYLVAPITLADVDEIFEATNTIVPRILRSAIERNPRAVADAFHRARHELTGDYDASALRLNYAIAEATGNSRLIDVLRRLFDQQRRVFTLAYRVAGPESWLTEGFERAARAIEAGNADAAVAELDRVGALAHQGAIKVLSSLHSIRTTAISL